MIGTPVIVIGTPVIMIYTCICDRYTCNYYVYTCKHDWHTCDRYPSDYHTFTCNYDRSTCKYDWHTCNCDMILFRYLTKQMPTRCEHLAEILLQPLFKLIPNSAKVMSTSGTVCIRFIIQVNKRASPSFDLFNHTGKQMSITFV